MFGCGDTPAGGAVTVGEVARLLGDVAVLKRVRRAGTERSAAELLFLECWARLCAGEAAGQVAGRGCGEALAGARLGMLDAGQRRALGVPPTVARAALGQSGQPWVDLFGDALDDAGPGEAAPPPVAERLCRQPRAGATRPGHRRLVLWPAESHGDHCLLVAVGGAMLAAAWGCDTSVAFLAGLAHHLHNARLPDIGFEGEVLLGDALEPLVARLRADELAALPRPLAAAIEQALDRTRDAQTPEGRAFHAADVIDRVQEVHVHAAAAAFRPEQALHDLDLVHPGPLQAYQQAVLRDAGLG